MITMDMIEMLYLRFAGIWGDRFTARHDERMLDIWHEEWLDGLQGIDPINFREALKYCKENLEWSPSIAEFIRICDRSLNIPDPRKCMAMLIRGDTSHPFTESMSKKISSWDLRNGIEKDVLRRITELHDEEMINFRRKRSLSAQQPREISHGSEISGDNTGRVCVRQATGYLF